MDNQSAWKAAEPPLLGEEKPNELSVQASEIVSLLFNKYLDNTLLFYYKFRKNKAAKTERMNLGSQDSETPTRYINFAIMPPTAFVSVYYIKLLMNC